MIRKPPAHQSVESRMAILSVAREVLLTTARGEIFARVSEPPRRGRVRVVPWGSHTVLELLVADVHAAVVVQATSDEWRQICQRQKAVFT
jgi:hypothetical protein